MDNDPFEIIKDDHQRVNVLFKEYEGLGESANGAKQKVVDQVIQALSVHTEMEETFCYPRFKDALPKEGDKKVDEANVEHEGIKNLLEKLKSLEPKDPEFDASMQVLIEQVRHHVKEEENDLLPMVQKKMSEEDLAAMGEEMLSFKDEQE